jgi:hypothetical protein
MKGKLVQLNFLVVQLPVWKSFLWHTISVGGLIGWVNTSKASVLLVNGYT